jgi:hypothetical protein
MKVCELTQVSVIISGNTVLCNEDDGMEVSEVELIGFSETSIVSITDSNVVLHSVNAILDTSSAVTISSSTVRLVLDGSSSFSSSDLDSPGLGCSSDSNVTIQAVLGGFLEAVGGSYAAGIGSITEASCGSLAILNSSLKSEGAVGVNYY